MNAELVEREFKRAVCEKVKLVPHGLNRFIVFQPFAFNDGDHFVVILRQDTLGWTLTDEGHTLMHVQYDDVDLSRGTRARVLGETLHSFAVENVDGELRLPVPGDKFGDALYSFLQALNKITDLEFLNREIVRSTFMEDARQLMESIIPAQRRFFDYHDPALDSKGNYMVDCLINGKKRPELVFFIPNEVRCQHATIVCHQFERWTRPFRATGIFEDMTAVHPRAYSQFADIAYKSIPSLGSDRLEPYFREVLSEQ
jgi:hypothetical protein